MLGATWRLGEKAAILTFFRPAFTVHTPSANFFFNAVTCDESDCLVPVMTGMTICLP